MLTADMYSFRMRAAEREEGGRRGGRGGGGGLGGGEGRGGGGVGEGEGGGGWGGGQKHQVAIPTSPWKGGATDPRRVGENL